MNTTLYNIALVTHIIGITVMAGTAYIDYVTFESFCKVFKLDKHQGLVLENYLHKLQRFLGIGLLIIIISGVGMMIQLHQVWGAQLWFKVKMGVLALIIINGFWFRRMAGSRLKKVIADNANNKEWDHMRSSFKIVQTIQILLFITIYVLSVFKFN